MIEAYKIAVNMTLTGDAQKKMMEFALLVEKASKDMDIFLLKLKGINTNFSFLSRELRQNTTLMKQFDAVLNQTSRHALSAGRNIHTLGNNITKTAKDGGGTAFGAGFIGGMASRYLAPGILAYQGVELAKAGFHQDVEFEKQMSMLSARGFTQGQIAQTRNFAMNQNIPGVSYNDMARAFVDALMATQDPSKAQFLAPTLAKGAAYARGVYGGISESQQQDLIRFAEFRGAGNAKNIKDQLELGFQIMALSGGSIKPDQLRSLVKYGGGATSKLSNEALLGLEPILQMFGGSRTGTALQTLNLSLIAGQMSTARGRSLTSLGMFDPNAISYDTTGRMLGSKFGKFKFGEELQTDPFRFLMSRYLPALSQQGINDPKQIEQRIQYDFSRTAAQILIQMYENSDKILRTLSQGRMLSRGDPMYQSWLKTPAGSSARFAAASQNFLTALGKLEEPQVIAGMNLLSGLLEKLATGFTYLSDLKSKYHLESLAETITNKGSTNKPFNIFVKAQVKEKTLLDIVHNSTPNQMVDHGSTQILPQYHGMSPGINNLGGGFSQ